MAFTFALLYYTYYFPSFFNILTKTCIQWYWITVEYSNDDQHSVAWNIPKSWKLNQNLIDAVNEAIKEGDKKVNICTANSARASLYPSVYQKVTNEV